MLVYAGEPEQYTTFMTFHSAIKAMNEKILSLRHQLRSLASVYKTTPSAEIKQLVKEEMLRKAFELQTIK